MSEPEPGTITIPRPTVIHYSNPLAPLQPLQPANYFPTGQPTYGPQGFQPHTAQGFPPQGPQGFQPHGPQGFQPHGPQGFQPHGPQGFPQGFETRNVAGECTPTAICITTISVILLVAGFATFIWYMIVLFF